MSVICPVLYGALGGFQMERNAVTAKNLNDDAMD